MMRSTIAKLLFIRIPEIINGWNSAHFKTIAEREKNAEFSK